MRNQVIQSLFNKQLDKFAFFFNNSNYSLHPYEFKLLYSIKKAFFNNEKSLLLQYLDVSNLYDIEHEFSPSLFKQAISIVHNIIQEKYISCLPRELKYLGSRLLLDDDMAIFCVLQEPLAPLELYDLDTKIRLKIHSKLEKSLPMIPPEKLRIRTGHHVISPQTCRNLDHALYTGLKQALKNAKSQEKSLSSSLIAQFEDILSSKNIVHLYQPIISLKYGNILGWEALARGPADSFFQSPSVLFPYAQETGSLLLLEELSQRNAISKLEKLRPQQKLFINVDSQSIHLLETFKERFVLLLKDKGFSHNNIVFEITERTSIQDFSAFKKVLTSLRKDGFSIAIDDAGAGYSSLQAIAELEPNYIKLDMSIIHNINKDQVKEALVQTFVTFAKKINSHLIAEGIETREELLTLIKLGVDFGQGYLLGKPEYPAHSYNNDTFRLIKSLNTKKAEKLSHNTIPIGSIVHNCPVILPDASVESVMDLFKKHPNLEGLVVSKEMVPLGLIMRQDLLTYLSSRYGVALYYKKPISSIMDANPLVVDATVTLEKASELATKRNSKNLYDHIIVTNKSFLSGIVSIRSLLEVITQTKIKIAQFANPLTGLPGNIRIQEEIERILKEDKIFTLTYADVDQFKKYNDRYGFEQGDLILLAFAKILKHSIKKYGDDSCFLGHIGGDDFILIMPPELTDQVNTCIIRLFNKLYSKNTTISLASITINPGRFNNHLELAEYAAKAKTEAKKINGCLYIKEDLDGIFSCIYSSSSH